MAHDQIRYHAHTVIEGELCKLDCERESFISMLRARDISLDHIQMYERCFPLIYITPEEDSDDVWYCDEPEPVYMYTRPYVGPYIDYMNSRTKCILARHKIYFNELPASYRIIFPLDEEQMEQLMAMNDARLAIIHRYDEEMRTLQLRKHNEIVDFVRTYFT